MTSSNPLRADEQFVIEQITRTYGGTWRPGNDPPDTYLTIGSSVIAVEISTLTQHVPSARGGTRPRQSDDATALWMINEVKMALRALVPDGRTVVLTITSPVQRARKTNVQLQSALRTYLASGDDIDAVVTLEGNSIRIHISPYDGPDAEKIHGLVPHQQSSPDILNNAQYILEERITVKDQKCRGIPGPKWLALFNDYWLADDATYLQALRMRPLTHTFEKIVLVAGDGTVTELDVTP